MEIDQTLADLDEKNLDLVLDLIDAYPVEEEEDGATEAPPEPSALGPPSPGCGRRLAFGLPYAACT